MAHPRNIPDSRTPPSNPPDIQKHTCRPRVLLPNLVITTTFRLDDHLDFMTLNTRRLDEVLPHNLSRTAKAAPSTHFAVRDVPSLRLPRHRTLSSWNFVFSTTTNGPRCNDVALPHSIYVTCFDHLRPHTVWRIAIAGSHA